MRIFFVSVCLAMVLKSLLFAGIVVTGHDARTFLQGRTGKLVYSKFEGNDGWKNGRSLWYIDLGENILVERKIVQFETSGDPDDPRNPIISPDGNWVVYNTRKGSGRPGSWYQTKVYLCRIEENTGDNRMIADGAQPHWWMKPGTGEEYLIYNDKDLEEGWSISGFPPTSANTYCVRLVNKYASGSSALLMGYYVNGGRSRDGRWLFTAGRMTGIIKIDAAAISNAWIGESHQFDNEGCNPSISSHDNEQDLRVMYLGETHEDFIIRKVNGETVWTLRADEASLDGLDAYWDTPEYSNDVDFASVVASPTFVEPPFSVYIVRISDKQALRITDGNDHWPYLWIDPSSGSAHPADNGLKPRAPIAVSFSGGAIRVRGDGLAGASVIVNDMLGRMVARRRIIGAGPAAVNIGAAGGTCIVKIVAGDGTRLYCGAIHAGGGKP